MLESTVLCVLSGWVKKSWWLLVSDLLCFLDEVILGGG